MEATTEDLTTTPLPVLCIRIKRDWAKVNYGAKPYLDALGQLDDLSQPYYEDSGKSVCLYFLANASTWRGPTAKAIKAELNRRCKLLR